MFQNNLIEINIRQMPALFGLKSKICKTFFSLTLRSNEDCGRTIHRTHLKRVSKESLRNFLAASIKTFENPSIFDRFIVKKLALR